MALPPAGRRADPVAAPQRLPIKHLLNFGYEGEVLHLVDIAVPPERCRPAKFRVNATWLVCNPGALSPGRRRSRLRTACGRRQALRWAEAIARTRAGAAREDAGHALRAARN
jgi:hypothetical protein